MLLGVLLTGTLLTGCGKNKATEAASESAQTEKEGTGEKTADSAEDDQKNECDDRPGQVAAQQLLDKVVALGFCLFSHLMPPFRCLRWC